MLFYWTTLDYSFARWIYNVKDTAESQVSTSSRRESKCDYEVIKYQNFHKRGRWIVNIGMSLFFIGVFTANIVIVVQQGHLYDCEDSPQQDCDDTKHL